MLYGELAKLPRHTQDIVLILIFLENALRPEQDLAKQKRQQVLILIFLENALRQDVLMMHHEYLGSLNPYFFGKCSTAKTQIYELKTNTMS